MVWSTDVVSDDERAVGEAASEIVRVANLRHGEGFIAVAAEARRNFWLDRARTTADRQSGQTLWSSIKTW